MKIFYVIFSFYFIENMHIKNPLISIIIPSYNIENKFYLKTAINSILTQNLKNIELIIVDDNATDETPKLLDKYALNEQRITVVHKKKNEMTGYARNTGLDFVMGEYLGFLDYDDFFHSNALLFAYTEAKKKNYSIIHFQHKKFKNEKDIMNDLKDSNDKYEIEKLEENFNYPIGKTGIYIWSNIYKSSFILSHNFKFVNTWADEDVLFCITIFSYMIDILVIKKILVFHRLLPSSIGHNHKPLNLRKKLILFHLRNIFNKWEKKGMMKERLKENSFIYIINAFFKDDIKNYIKFIKSFRTIFPQNIIKILFIRNFDYKNINKIYTYNDLNFNLYESLIINKKKCYL